MSRFLTTEIANAAIDVYFEEMFLKVLANQRKGFHITILDPTRPFQEMEFPRQNHSLLHFLAERSCNEDEWAGSDVRQIARLKAYLSHREKMNSGSVPRHMLCYGDIKWAGAVYYNGIVVAVSGFVEETDEKYARLIAIKCEQLAEAAYIEWNNLNKTESFV